MDNRLALVMRSLEARVPLDQREARSRVRALAALAALPEPFDREADPTHVTGSAIVIGGQGVLLHRHRRLGVWLQPGGHIDGDETPWAAAGREAQEETGLVVKFTDGEKGLAHVDVHDGGRGHTHLDLRYVFTVVGDETPRPPAGESQEVRWFDWEEAMGTADEGLVAVLRSLRP